MRILKSKLARARQSSSPQTDKSDGSRHADQVRIKHEMQEVKLEFQEPKVKKEERGSPPKKRAQKETSSPGKASAGSQANSSKNIVKNYGRAIAAFTLSEIALPYLEPLVKREGISLEDFKYFISTGKESIDGISSFRSLLLMTEEETAKIRSFKIILGEMSVIFIKYFSVNWIFSSKLRNRIAHLKCRFKMLRRILDPEHFTYLKTTS